MESVNQPVFGEDTALIVVDVQNDFAHKRGSLYVPDGEKIIPPVNNLIARAGQAGSPVVYTQDWHPPVTPHFEPYGGTWPVHCVRGTWGAEFHPELEVGDLIVRKGTGGEDGYSGFTVVDDETGVESSTELDSILGRHQVRRVVVVGLAQDVCVKETALDARRRGYQTVVVLEATRPVNLRPDDENRANQQMVAAGVKVV
ncbi:MAG: isochorismatase family protein [Actinomycetota bacterium]